MITLKQRLLIICCMLAASCTKQDLTVISSNPVSVTKSSTLLAKNKQTSWIINTICGNGDYGYSGDGGPASNAILGGPGNVNIDKDGNIYICDVGNNVIRKIDSKTNIITTVAGNGSQGFSGDGKLATNASLNVAFHTAIDVYGNLYIADLSNNRIRKVDKSTGIITTIAGTGVPGYNGDGNALTTNISFPFGIALDNHQNLIISEGTYLRKLNLISGMVTTILGHGTSGFSGDGGPASQAEVGFIWNIAADNQDNIYLTDQANYRVRKIDGKTGIINTIAGNGINGNSGDGGKATDASFVQPTSVAVDNSANVYIGDEVLNQLYKIDKQTGIINRIAGNGTYGFSGDGGPAINATFSNVNSISVDQKGDIYVNDAFNNRVRKLSLQNIPDTTHIH